MIFTELLENVTHHYDYYEQKQSQHRKVRDNSDKLKFQQFFLTYHIKILIHFYFLEFFSIKMPISL